MTFSPVHRFSFLGPILVHSNHCISGTLYNFCFSVVMTLSTKAWEGLSFMTGSEKAKYSVMQTEFTGPEYRKHFHWTGRVKKCKAHSTQLMGRLSYGQLPTCTSHKGPVSPTVKGDRHAGISLPAYQHWLKASQSWGKTALTFMSKLEEVGWTVLIIKIHLQRCSLCHSAGSHKSSTDSRNTNAIKPGNRAAHHRAADHIHPLNFQIIFSSTTHH